METRIDIKQHIPGFVSGVEPIDLHGIDIESILELEFIKRWSEDKDFIRFMMSTKERDNKYSQLMVEINNGERKSGKTYWVVASIFPAEEIKKLNLPEWDPNDYER